MDGFLQFFYTLSGNIWLYGVVFLAVLSLLVFVHEWGHYIVARLCGVRVEVFSIGFGRELCGRTDGHGTRWKLSLIPLGGYVKMFGDVDPASARHAEGAEDESGEMRPFTENEKQVAFFARPVGQRAAIVFAGPAINFLFAIFLLAILYASLGKPVTPPVVSAVAIGSAAEAGGLKPHDRIVRIGGTEILDFESVQREVILALDTPTQFVVERGGRQETLLITPERKSGEDRFGFRHERGYLGVVGPSRGFRVESIVSVDGMETRDKPELARRYLMERMGREVVVELDRSSIVDKMIVRPMAERNAGLDDEGAENYNVLIVGDERGQDIVHYSIPGAVAAAVAETAKVTGDTLKAIGQMIVGSRSATELGGIIRIGAVAGDMAQQGWIQLITFTALLSINLGLINLFPVPMLDGGHLVFYAVEAVRGSPIPENIQEYAFRVGLVILVGLMLFANINDIIQIVL